MWGKHWGNEQDCKLVLEWGKVLVPFLWVQMVLALEWAKVFVVDFLVVEWAAALAAEWGEEGRTV